MEVKDAMTPKPKTIKKTDTLEKLLDLMANNKISGCPVVDNNNHVIGIITQTDVINIIDVHSKIHKLESDLFTLVLAAIKSEHYDNLREALKKVMKMQVKNFMRDKVVTIDVNDDLYDAAKMMNRNKVDRLPVTRNKKLVGIITRWDIIKALDKLDRRK